jgi:hypothetical protein
VEKAMEKPTYRSWEDFKKDEYRRCGTFQLSIDELARDLYYEDQLYNNEEEEEELNFEK